MKTFFSVSNIANVDRKLSTVNRAPIFISISVSGLGLADENTELKMWFKLL